VQKRIEHKVLSLVFSCIKGCALAYLKELLQLRFPPSAAEVGSFLHRSALFRVFGAFMECLSAVFLSGFA
jgi:hypothetical protein